MYLLLAATHQLIVTNSNMSISVNKSNFTFVFFKNACVSNPSSGRK